MKTEYEQLTKAKIGLQKEYQDLKDKRLILRSDIFKGLFEQIKSIPPNERSEFGKQLNDLKQSFKELIDNSVAQVSSNLESIDVTAPFGVNLSAEDLKLLSPLQGSIHPLMKELDIILDIFYGLGFNVIESVEIDDDYHMFSSLNFPEDHPARDDFDTFSLIQQDSSKKPLIAPAHTSTMQNRVLKAHSQELIRDAKPIAYAIPGRVFRKEDVDPRHEHTFYQLEGIYVDKNVSVSNLMATLNSLMTSYFNTNLEFKTQPFYFPFTEPSFEFAVSCPYCQKEGCKVCSYSGWIELLGCGMVHPNVLKMAGIDPNIYSGFAFGVGFMRMTMIKYGIEDIRYFLSSKLNFLEQFK